MTSSIQTYYQRHKELIEEYLLLSEDPANTEAIHNLRLSIKRIRVVGVLADKISDDTFGSKSRLIAINILFKRSGRLRDIQVIKQLLMEFNDLTLIPVIDMFAKREIKQRSKFEVALTAFDKVYFDDFEDDLKEVLADVSDKKALACGNTLLNDLEWEMKEIYHSSTDEERMHKIRTRLKDINYLNNIFDEQLPIREYLHINIERLRELGEMAGAWHDCLNLEREMQKFILKNPETTTLISLQNFILELKLKKEGLYQEYNCILLNEVRI